MDAPDNAADGKPGLWYLVKKRFESALTDVANSPVRVLLIQHPSVQLRIHWRGQSMSIDELPDGIRSILGWLGACIGKIVHTFPEHLHPLDVPLVLLIDEPEGHLHPKWQRQVLVAAQKLLPNAQIIASTHSPFLISSINEGYIHILRVDEKTGLVTHDQPLKCSKGDTYLDVLEDVLGLGYNQQFDPETEKMLGEFNELLESIKGGDWSQEARLLELGRQIARRSDQLEGDIGRQLHLVSNLRTVRKAPSKAAATPVKGKAGNGASSTKTARRKSAKATA
jgi:hypothetical protein